MNMDVYTSIKHSVKTIFDIDLDQYKDEQMRRRLDSWLVRSRAPSWDAYLYRMAQDALERDRFRSYLTINVSEFFRDTNHWKRLQDIILPGLLADKAGRGILRIWSAGCSIGAEPYSLAMLLDEIAPQQKYSLLATDLDRDVLQRARAGGPYQASEIQNMPGRHRERYMTSSANQQFFVKPQVGRSITFREHNLLADPFESDFDLILCRNVTIYFTNTAKQQLFARFHDALRPGGLLFVGGTEMIPHPKEMGFASEQISFYRRLR